ncbi:hypothetical protein MRB53_004922 [Persea americana]|uniref:Uncharacterized protein n=1 Tax=Persea americana TaxID=3435 RepID=A0ACC2MC32_PERAE|nr:hypothetical protein MRB53_004922 [Persea americana]
MDAHMEGLRLRQRILNRLVILHWTVIIGWIIPLREDILPLNWQRWRLLFIKTMMLSAGIAPHRREVALPVPLVTGKLLASSPRVAGVRVAVAVLVRRWFPEPELEEEDSRKGAVLGSAGPHLSV